MASVGCMACVWLHLQLPQIPNWLKWLAIHAGVGRSGRGHDTGSPAPFVHTAVGYFAGAKGHLHCSYIKTSVASMTLQPSIPKHVRCPAKAFVALVLLAAWIEPKPSFCSMSFDMLEYFAGRARISRLVRAAGYEALATDMVYDPKWQTRSSLQLNESAGLSLLAKLSKNYKAYI